MNIEENKKLWAKIVAQAWINEDYKKELLANSQEVLLREGAEIPEGITVHVVETPTESTGADIYLYLPKPHETASLNLTEDRKAAETAAPGWEGAWT